MPVEMTIKYDGGAPILFRRGGHNTLLALSFG